jgi:hypothetical protein
MPARRLENGEWFVPEEERLFIPQPELAAKLGLSTSTISRWVVQDYLPCTAIGGRKHIRRDLIWDFIDEMTTEGRLDELFQQRSHCPHCNRSIK